MIPTTNVHIRYNSVSVCRWRLHVIHACIYFGAGLKEDAPRGQIIKKHSFPLKRSFFRENSYSVTFFLFFFHVLFPRSFPVSFSRHQILGPMAPLALHENKSLRVYNFQYHNTETLTSRVHIFLRRYDCDNLQMCFGIL